MTLLEFYLLQNRLATMDVPTRKEFGQIMHDKSVSEEVKQEILKKVEMEGGYDNLANS